MSTEKTTELDALVRDLTSVHPRPKSEVREMLLSLLRDHTMGLVAELGKLIPTGEQQIEVTVSGNYTTGNYIAAGYARALSTAQHLLRESLKKI